MKFETQTHLQRFILGIVCGLLPILCVLFGIPSVLVGNNPIELLYSISATYYSNHNIIMIGSLILCAFFLFTYKGYDLGDRLFTLLAGIGALGVACFPCYVYKLDFTHIGLFSLPVNVSNIAHFISAGLVFSSFALMTLTQFTKGSHKNRNLVYYICAGIMLAALAFTPLYNNVFHLPDYWMMILEFIMLEAFAVAWLVKSGIFFKE